MAPPPPSTETSQLRLLLLKTLEDVQTLRAQIKQDMRQLDPSVRTTPPRPVAVVEALGEAGMPAAAAHEDTAPTPSAAPAGPGSTSSPGSNEVSPPMGGSQSGGSGGALGAGGLGSKKYSRTHYREVVDRLNLWANPVWQDMGCGDENEPEAGQGDENDEWTGWVSASEAEQGSSGAATGGTGAGGVTGVSRTPQRRHSLGHGRSSARTSKAATPEAKLQGRRSLSTRAASAAAADGAADTSPTTTGVDASSCRATPLRSALQKLNAGSAGRSLGLGYPGSQHAAASPGVGSLAGPDLPSASTSPVALVATRSSSFTRAAAAHLRASAPLNRRSLNLSSGVAGPAGGAGSLRGSVHGLGTGEVSLGAGAWGVGVVLSSREREREAKDSARGRERDRDSLSLKSLTSSTSSVGGGIGRRFPGIGRLSGTAAPAAATPREDAAANAVGQQGQQPQQQAAQGEKHAPEPRAQLPRPAFESASRLPPAPSAAPAASAVLDLAGLGVRALSLGPPRSSLAQPGSAKAALGQQEPSSAKAALLSQPGSARVVTPTNQFAPFSHGPFATTPNGSQAGGPGGGAVSAAGLLMPGSAGAVQVAAWGATSPAMSCSMGLTPLPMMLPSASRVAREEGSERAPEGVGASNGSGSEVALPGLPFQHGLALLAGGRATGTLALGGHLAAAAGLSLGSAGKGAGGVLRRTLSDPDLLAAAGLVATGAVVIAGDAGAEVRGLQAEAAAHAAVAAQ